MCMLACCVWWSGGTKLRAAEIGASARPAWTSSTVKGTPEPPPPLRARPFYEHVRFKNPTSLTTAPGSDRFFVTEFPDQISRLIGHDSPDGGEIDPDLKSIV